MEVYEATEPLRIFALKEDEKGAKTKDWGACVFAKACGRMFGSRRVAFFRRAAYVELPDREGKRCVERFKVGESMRRDIEKFDKSHVPPAGGFKLDPPRPSETLEGMAKNHKRRVADPASRKRRAAQQKAYHQKRKRKAAINGKRRGAHLPLIELEWRSGTGMVHFAAKNKPQIHRAAK